MDWLGEFTNWLKEQLQALWDAFVEFMGDLLVMLVETILDLVATAFEAIPVPDFLAQYSIGALLSQAGPTFAWLFGSLRMPEAFAILGAGYAFRLLRKLLTLGQW